MSNQEKIRELFQAGYGRNQWLLQLQQFFPDMKVFSHPQTVDHAQAEAFVHLGNVPVDGQSQPLGIYEIKIWANTQLPRNRVQLRQMVAKQFPAKDLSGALAVYLDDNNEQWRFSFIAVEYRFDENHQLIPEKTASKRFTYLLGRGANTRTAVERFAALPQNPSLQDLKDAFAVEPLNKEFYDKLYRWYEKAQGEVTFPNDEKAENHTATSLIRLLTRLLFVWFIKEKKLVNPDLFVEEKLQTLLHWDKHSSYYKAILQNLFFATLNREVSDRCFRKTTDGKANSNNYLITNIYRHQGYFQDNNEDNILALFNGTPFLNGGLFECLDREASDKEKQDYDENKSIRPVKSAIRMDGFSDREDNAIKIPNTLFFNADETGLIDLLSQYQFTVEESTPLDVDVALDPELLGLVFENLLAAYNPETQETARKTTGSFYTPREIVGYMVDESLKARLAEAVSPHDDDTKFWRERLDDLFDQASRTGELNKNGEDPLIYPEEIPSLIDAINRIKILDPAVGSGAFPMGCLQRLVQLLAILDPENEQWKQQQLSSLPALTSIQADLKTTEKISDQQARTKAQEELAKREQEIKTVFDQQDHSYTRKLYLIESAIYGVDIQPIAIQIAKLRFFISLVIEQQSKGKIKDNYGIKALPNLETKFVAADSLLKLKTEIRGETLQLRIEDIQEKKRDLNEVRHRYFNAKTSKTKRKYREEDKALREEIAVLLKNYGWDGDNAQKIAYWDPYDQNASAADWYDSEWMFGIADGFDVVIGNPPYIQLQKDGGKLGNLYKNSGYQTFSAAGDIYQLFYERACQLLKPKDGLLCFITSNSWLKAKYGEKLRRYFCDHHTPLKLLEMGKDIFENAIVDTNILLIRNGKINETGKAVDMDRLLSKNFPPEEKHWGELRPQGEKPWMALSAVEQGIMDKIEAAGTPLKEWDIDIYYGIKTGCNDAFIIDKATKDALVAADPSSIEILKPILRGRDIKRYQAQWAELWLIATFPSLHIDIESYPAIKRHLLFYGKDRLEQTGKTFADGSKSRKKTPHQWFELQDTCAYHAEFERDKLVWIELVENGRFAYDNSGICCEATTFIMTGNHLKYLCVLLNSKLIRWFLQQAAPTSGMGTLRWKKVYVETIPIPPIPTDTQKKPFIYLADQIIAAKANDHTTDTTALESKIDALVYQLYGLTDTEISLMGPD